MNKISFILFFALCASVLAVELDCLKKKRNCIPKPRRAGSGYFYLSCRGPSGIVLSGACGPNEICNEQGDNPCGSKTDRRFLSGLNPFSWANSLANVAGQVAGAGASSIINVPLNFLYGGLNGFFNPFGTPLYYPPPPVNAPPPQTPPSTAPPVAAPPTTTSSTTTSTTAPTTTTPSTTTASTTTDSTTTATTVAP